MIKIDWNATCSKCVYGTTKNKRSSAKGRCRHKNPKTHFEEEIGWVCESFKRRWDTMEDLAKSKNGE